MQRSYPFLLLLGLLFHITMVAQTKQGGPIITDFGEVFIVNDIDFVVNTSMEFKAVFDIMNSPDDLETLNSSIETAARFLNMHAQNGVPKEQIKNSVGRP